MAKVECFTPDGKMEMKEPVDAKECVESCGYTMEAPKTIPIVLTRKDPDMVIGMEENIEEEIISEEAPVENKRGRKRKNK
jgi:hypothetical protein